MPFSNFGQRLQKNNGFITRIKLNNRTYRCRTPYKRRKGNKIDSLLPNILFSIFMYKVLPIFADNSL